MELFEIILVGIFEILYSYLIRIFFSDSIPLIA